MHRDWTQKKNCSINLPTILPSPPKNAKVIAIGRWWTIKGSGSLSCHNAMDNNQLNNMKNAIG